MGTITEGKREIILPFEAKPNKTLVELIRVSDGEVLTLGQIPNLAPISNPGDHTPSMNDLQLSLYNGGKIDFVVTTPPQTISKKDIGPMYKGLGNILVPGDTGEIGKTFMDKFKWIQSHTFYWVEVFDGTKVTSFNIFTTPQMIDDNVRTTISTSVTEALLYDITYDGVVYPAGTFITITRGSKQIQGANITPGIVDNYYAITVHLPATQKPTEHTTYRFTKTTTGYEWVNLKDPTDKTFVYPSVVGANQRMEIRY